MSIPLVPVSRRPSGRFSESGRERLSRSRDLSLSTRLTSPWPLFAVFYSVFAVSRSLFVVLIVVSL